MKRAWTRAAMTAVVAACAGAVLLAGEMAVNGQLQDPACKPKDLACSVAGAKAGHPLQLNGTDGHVYQLTGKYAGKGAAALASLIGKTVQAKGNVNLAAGKRLMNATSIELAKAK